MDQVYKCRHCDVSLGDVDDRPKVLTRCPECNKLNVFLTVSDNGGLAFADLQILQEVGQGANAVVCKARANEDSGIYAVKLFFSEKDADTHSRREFDREIAFSTQVIHDNICRTYGGGECDGVLFLKLEFIDGINLAQYLEYYGPMNQYDALSVGTYAARALDFVWSQHLTIHRDVKPQNIMVDRQGLVKVLDFGLVTTHEQSIVDTSAVEGTPYYLSPESITHDAYQDNRSDLYSLGATLYHLITGYPPFDYESLLDVINARLEEDPPDMRDIFPEVDKGVADIVRTMMSKDPADRYITAIECEEDMQRVKRGEAPLLVDHNRPKFNA